MVKLGKRSGACIFCGIHPGNGLGISIISYSIVLEVPDRASFGELPICDRCIVEKHRGASMVTAGFRTEARK